MSDLVTVGITCFNAADTIERAVRSALGQSWPAVEVLVVDDRSSDDSPTILRRISRSDSRVRVHYRDIRGGVAVARNDILARANGTFVAFFDDDDVSLPGRLYQQISAITAHEAVVGADAAVICHSARLLDYGSGRYEVAPTMGAAANLPIPCGLAVAERILIGRFLKNGFGACPTSSQLARRRTYEAVGGFDPRFARGEDTEFSIRLARAGGHFVGVAQPLVIATMTATADKGLEADQRAFEAILEKHRDLAEARGAYGFCTKWLRMRRAWMFRRRCLFASRLLGIASVHPQLTLERGAIALRNWYANRQFRNFLDERDTPWQGDKG